MTAFFRTHPNHTEAAESAACANQPDTSPAGLVFRNSRPAHSLKAYNKFLDSATPVIFASWINADDNGGTPWANASMVCITSDRHSSAGSRIVPRWIVAVVALLVIGVSY